MNLDEAVLNAALLMAQQSCDKKTYSKFLDAYNQLIEVRNLQLPKIAVEALPKADRLTTLRNLAAYARSCKTPRPTRAVAPSAVPAKSEKSTLPDALRLLNKAEIAKRIGSTKRGVDALIKQRRIPYFRLGHKTVRFSLERVLLALDKKEQASIQ